MEAMFAIIAQTCCSLHYGVGSSLQACARQHVDFKTEKAIKVNSSDLCTATDPSYQIRSHAPKLASELHSSTTTSLFSQIRPLGLNGWQMMRESPLDFLQ
jgi:hypothetical protein